MCVCVSLCSSIQREGQDTGTLYDKNGDIEDGRLVVGTNETKVTDLRYSGWQGKWRFGS